MYVFIICLSECRGRVSKALLSSAHLGMCRRVLHLPTCCIYRIFALHLHSSRDLCWHLRELLAIPAAHFTHALPACRHHTLQHVSAAASHAAVLPRLLLDLDTCRTRYQSRCHLYIIVPLRACCTWVRLALLLQYFVEVFLALLLRWGQST